MFFNFPLRIKILPVTKWLQRQGKKPLVLPNQSHSWYCHLLLSTGVTLSVFFARCGQNWYPILKKKKRRKPIRTCDVTSVYQNPWWNRRKKNERVSKEDLAIQMILFWWVLNTSRYGLWCLFHKDTISRSMLEKGMDRMKHTLSYGHIANNTRKGW